MITFGFNAKNIYTISIKSQVFANKNKISNGFIFFIVFSLFYKK